MKNYLVFILSTLILCASCVQSVKKNPDAKFIDFINSFEEIKTSDILCLEEEHSGKKRLYNPMTKEEALSFVYKTSDTTVLYCNYAQRFGNDYTELTLPDKCFKIKIDDYFLIAYSSFKCQNSNDYHRLMTLCIVDSGFNMRDCMLVIDYTSYYPAMSGLLNAKNGKIFINKIENGKRKGLMYKINEDLKFELIKEGEVVARTEAFCDGLKKDIENLKWEDFFE